MERSRHKAPLFVCMVLRAEWSTSTHPINLKALLAFPVPGPYRVSKLVNSFALQAQAGLSLQTSDKPFLVQGRYPSFLQ